MTIQPGRMTRIHALDGLRGYAALAVVLFHSMGIFIERRPGGSMNDLLGASIWSVPNGEVTTRVILALLNGQTAVTIFFAISGAVLIRSMRAETAKEWLLLPFYFTIKRITRIYPALIFCLICFFVMFKALSLWFPTRFTPYTTNQFFENATLHSITMHGATWTLQAEMLAIPLLLLAFALKRSVGIIGLVGMLCYSLVVREEPILALGSTSAYVWMPYFMVGILAAQFAKAAAMREATNNGKWSISLFTLLFVTSATNPAYVAASIVQCVAVFLFVGHIISDTDSSLKRFLSCPTSQYLGRISYSLYLWNVPFLVLIQSVLTSQTFTDHATSFGILTGCFLTLITLPIAHLSERYVERLYKVFFDDKQVVAPRAQA